MVIKVDYEVMLLIRFKKGKEINGKIIVVNKIMKWKFFKYFLKI